MLVICMAIILLNKPHICSAHTHTHAVLQSIMMSHVHNVDLWHRDNPVMLHHKVNSTVNFPEKVSHFPNPVCKNNSVPNYSISIIRLKQALLSQVWNVDEFPCPCLAVCIHQ